MVYLGSLGLTLYFALGVSHLYPIFCSTFIPNSSITCLFTVLTFIFQRHSYLGSLVCGIIQVSTHRIYCSESDSPCWQVIALIAYILQFFPGGLQTLRFGGQVALRGAGSLLPV